MPQSKESTQYAKLYIASEQWQIEAIKWRLALIEKHKIYPISDLRKMLSRLTKNSTDKPTQEERKKFSKYAIDEKFSIDEFDQAALFAIKLLIKDSDFTDSQVVNLDRHLRTFFKIKGGNLTEFCSQNRQHIEFAKTNLKSHGHFLLENEASKIRSYLALKELAAVFDPDTMIPHLVAISPKYLASHLSIKWIRLQQYHSQFGNTTDSNRANRNLKNLQKAITGDKRAHKKRERPHWHVLFVYDDLSGYISGFRRHKEEGKLDKDFFDMYCEDRKISDFHKRHIVNSEIHACELAIEIMIESGQIKSEKTLREIQTKLSKVQQRHFGGSILGIADDIRPVVFDFIDLPSTKPEIIAMANVLEVLEQVKI